MITPSRVEGRGKGEGLGVGGGDLAETVCGNACQQEGPRAISGPPPLTQDEV